MEAKDTEIMSILTNAFGNRIPEGAFRAVTDAYKAGYEQGKSERSFNQWGQETTDLEIRREARLAGIREVVETVEIQQFLWFADNVTCVSVLLGDVIQNCGCATCVARNLKAKLKEWGI